MSESKDVILGRVVRKILFNEATFKQKHGGEGGKMETSGQRGTASTTVVR